MTDSLFFDELETRSRAEREQALFAALPAQVTNAQQNAPAFADILNGVDASAITSHEALAQLPVTRKSALTALQKQNPPFGGLTAKAAPQMRRIFSSPGPIYEPEARRVDYWRMARALYAAGFREGDIVHNSLSYHLTPGGWIFDDAAQALGCAVFPAGVGQTELQVTSIVDVQSTGYMGTPSFLKIMLDKAADMQVSLSSLKKAFVSGEALLPAVRQQINDAGISICQGYATADLGLIAYETSAGEGLVIDEGVIVEIVRPGTGDPVAEGEVGEVVVTTLNPEYPLIRFATGDLSAVLAGESPCGRTNMRIKGWMGRADQTTKVKGMFVHPEQIAEVIKRHTEIQNARLIVAHEGVNDIMTLRCEVANSDDSLADTIKNTVREVCKLRSDVEFVTPKSLPNDGKVIDDVRKFD